MTDKHTLYLPNELWERMVKHVARETAETGEQVSVSAFVREAVEEMMRTQERRRAK